MIKWIKNLFWKPDLIDLSLFESQVRRDCEELSREIDEYYSNLIATTAVYRVFRTEDIGTALKYHLLGEFETLEEAEEFRNYRRLCICKEPKDENWWKKFKRKEK